MSAAAMPALINREQVILNHLPQVKIIASKFHRCCPSEVLLEDLVSAGVVGLLDAYSRFDSRRNLRFKTFAEHRIRGAIIDYLRQLDPLPRSVRRFQKDREAAISRISQRHQRRAAEQDITAELGVSVELYRKFAAMADATTISLDAATPHDSHLHDIADPDTLYHPECAILTHAVEAAIRDLPGPERAVVTAIRNGDSHRAIAESLHVTDGRVSQIKRRALGYLRARLGVRAPA
jgi:RNA polymerase sigma factor for flagellar operon FliA